ncbi:MULTISPECIES: nuclear transport factor 2 family protein [unclassified Arthrobacter]|uniref:nuclear transport factor 2 family protein n=1 Tax=unclassified Arthrobacter TaxID=235627 RepID=UPI001C85FBA5|nr:nuclear transport factor 2 family protein [Arthrobacter sp. MAHUQ-56]MBX7442928.1 nuclear transport factor 2 family protein [Arthrobacter sp. MAHUQ-56]
MSDVVDKLAAALNGHDLEAAAALIHEHYRSEQPAHPGKRCLPAFPISALT